MSLFLQFRDRGGMQKICMIYDQDGKEVIEEVHSLEQVGAKQAELGLSYVGLSSTIFHSEDETDDPVQIALAEAMTE